jgi:hypothetical protein
LALADEIRLLTAREFKNMTRKEYLIGVAEDYGIRRADVFALADLLGESEDYDGLLSMLADYSDDLEDLDD